MTATCKSITLNTGRKMPMLGFGTWQTPKEVVQKCVETAIDEGYRHIDGAWVYQNEEGVGDAVQAKIREGKITREEIFITSKLWSTFHNKADVKDHLMETLKFLKTDYVDLYLMHWPFSFKKEGNTIIPKNEDGTVKFDDIDYVETWKAMEELYHKGLAKHIGVSNFNIYQMKRVLDACMIVPAVNQIETHPYLQETELIELCRKNKIAITAYSPLGSPRRPWGKPEEPVIMEDPVIKEIASRMGKTAAQIMLRFQIQRDVIVIPKSEKAHRIKENAQIFDFALSDEDFQKIVRLNRNWRACGMNSVKDVPFWPFHENYKEKGFGGSW